MSTYSDAGFVVATMLALVNLGVAAAFESNRFYFLVMLACIFLVAVGYVVTGKRGWSMVGP